MPLHVLRSSACAGTMFASVAFAQTPCVDSTVSINDAITCLANAVEPISTFSAEYEIENRSIADAQEFEHTIHGRIFIEQDSNGVRMAVTRDLAGLPEMQLIYTPDKCVRYFPFAHYGQRIDHQLDQVNQTDFAKYWRPFLIRLIPTQFATVPSLQILEVLDNGQPVHVLASRPNRQAEYAARPRPYHLESWGVRPDREFIFDGDNRLERVDTHVIQRRQVSPYEETERKAIKLWFEQTQTVNGVAVPHQLRCESQNIGQSSVHRAAIITLTNVTVNAPLPSGAFQPIWPEDFIHIWVVNPGPEELEQSLSDPASLVGLADYYMCTGRASEAEQWIEALETHIGQDLATPSEAAELARLYVNRGDKPLGDAVFSNVIAAREAERSTFNPIPLEVELQDVRYYAEAGNHRSRSTGREEHQDAVDWMVQKAGSLTHPLAYARLMGYAAKQMAIVNDYTAALAILDTAEQAVQQNADALQWISAVQLQVQSNADRAVVMAAHASRRAQIKAVLTQIRELREQGLSNSSAEIQALQAQLDDLRQQP